MCAPSAHGDILPIVVPIALLLVIVVVTTIALSIAFASMFVLSIAVVPMAMIVLPIVPATVIVRLVFRGSYEVHRPITGVVFSAVLAPISRMPGRHV